MNFGVTILAIISVISILVACLLIRWFSQQSGARNKVAIIATIAVIISIIAIWVIVFYLINF